MRIPRVLTAAAALALARFGLVAPLAAATPARPPNVVIILADDMGWGDVGVFGNPTIRTPRLDRMAAEGQKWTSLDVAGRHSDVTAAIRAVAAAHARTLVPVENQFTKRRAHSVLSQRFAHEEARGEASRELFFRLAMGPH
jgi:hypothetical protein